MLCSFLSDGSGFEPLAAFPSFFGNMTIKDFVDSEWKTLDELRGSTHVIISSFSNAILLDFFYLVDPFYLLHIQRGYFNVVATVYGFHIDNKWYYNYCPRCYMKVHIKQNDIWCNTCNQVLLFAVPRYKVNSY